MRQPLGERNRDPSGQELPGDRRGLRNAGRRYASIAGDATPQDGDGAPDVGGEPLAEGETIPVPPEGSQAATPRPARRSAPDPEGQKPLPRRALDMITGVLPSREQLKSVVTTPVHTLEDGYSWVARRFTGQ